MAEFKSFDSRVEVNGQTILSILEGMRGFEVSARKILFKYGIGNPVHNKWYSQQSWLDAFEHITSKIGSVVLKNIGKKIPENANWPIHINSITSALKSIDIAYHMNHRINKKILYDHKTGNLHEGIGNYIFKKISKNSVKMICNNPYPCSFDKGIIKAIVLKFKPHGYSVLFKEHIANGCRKNGDNSCTYYITWQKKIV